MDQDSYEVDLKPVEYHDDSICGECTYVANLESIVVSPEKIESCMLSDFELLSPRVFKNWEKKIVNLGKYTMHGWTGHLNVFLFHCLQCFKVSTDYVHGHNPYLTCQNCSTNFYLRTERMFGEAGYDYTRESILASWLKRRKFNKEMRKLMRANNRKKYGSVTSSEKD